MKTIIVMDYPQTFSFKVRKELPKFNEDDYCEVRREILIRQMKRQNIDSPCHSYYDYVVGIVKEFDNGNIKGEIWHLFS